MYNGWLILNDGYLDRKYRCIECRTMYFCIFALGTMVRIIILHCCFIMRYMRKRIGYLVAFIAVIVIGLLSRRMPFIPDGVGDALWAVMVLCALRILFAKCRLLWVSVAALVVSYCVELSQLWHTEWLDSFRSTIVGHLLLGQGFLWSDLLAYTVGVVIAYGVALNIEKKKDYDRTEE